MILQSSERIKYKISRIAHLTIQCLAKFLETSTLNVTSDHVYCIYNAFYYFLNQ
jgi:hypothetical protein